MTIVSYFLIISAFTLIITFTSVYTFAESDKTMLAYAISGCIAAVLLVFMLVTFILRTEKLKSLTDPNKATGAYNNVLCLVNNSDITKTYIVSKETILFSDITEYELKPNESVYKTTMTGGYKVLREK